MFQTLTLILLAAPAQAMNISEYVQFFRTDLDPLGIPGGTPQATEAVTVRNGVFDPATDADTVWITGTQGVTGFVFKFFFVPDFADPASSLLLPAALPVAHPFGKDAEGLAFAGPNRLLLSNAPDRPNPSSGVYQLNVPALDAEMLQIDAFLPSAPATRPEGLGLNPADIGATPFDLWIADEGKNQAFMFVGTSNLSLEESFETFERPEGIAVFGEDILLVDDGGDGLPGSLGQFDSEGELEYALDTGQFGLADPQGVEYDPMRDFVYVINDADLLIPGDKASLLVLTHPSTLAAMAAATTAGGGTFGSPPTPTPTPEPRAAIVFFTQLLVVLGALRRRRRAR